MNSYITDTNKLTCSCKDWSEVRFAYGIDNPRRLCKHIINKLDIDNLPNNLKYFKSDIGFYQEKEKGFNKEFKRVIALLDNKYIALYNDDDWTNIYNEDGESFALIITSFNDDFKWAKDKKPKDYQEIEIFFDKDEKFVNIAINEASKAIDKLNSRPRKRLGFKHPMKFLTN